MTTAFQRPLRLARAFWLGRVGLSPALSLADSIEGPEGTVETPSDVAPDAIAIMDPNEIKKTLDDLTIYGRYVDGENWIEYHLPDGRTAYWEKGCTYPGKWWMEQHQVCSAYPNYPDSAANCFVLYRRPSAEIQFVAIADAGFAYLASFSLKTAVGNDGAPPIRSRPP